MAQWANEDRYNTLIERASTRYGVPVPIIKAIIAAESGFRPAAYRAEPTRGAPPPSDWPPGVTSDASRGLMQILLWRARELGLVGSASTLMDPATNIDLGTKLLSINYSILGSFPDAISAYNGGIRPELGFGTVRADGTYRNQDYVDRVSRYTAYFITGVPPAGEGMAALAGVGTVGILALGALLLFLFARG